MKTPAPCAPLIDPLGPDHVAVAQDFAQKNIDGRSTHETSISLISPLAVVTAMFRRFHTRTQASTTAHHGKHGPDLLGSSFVLDRSSHRKLAGG